MIQRWQVKAMVQGLFSTLPYGSHLNYFVQRRTGNLVKSISIDKLPTGVAWAQRHVDWHEQYASQPIDETTVLELGTGWFPTVPITLYLCGFRDIYPIDVKLLVFEEYFRSMLRAYAGIEFDQLKQDAPSALPAQFAEFQRIASESSSLDVEQILERLHITSLVVDARRTNFADASFDFIISNNALEHIAPEILRPILEEFVRIGHEETILSHLIDMKDHYSFFDSNITMYNFLKYSRAQWRWFNNDLHYQSRQRLLDYQALYHQANLQIIHEEAPVTDEDRAQLARVDVHPDFQSYSQEELAVHTVWHVLKNA